MKRKLLKVRQVTLSAGCFAVALLWHSEGFASPSETGVRDHKKVNMLDRAVTGTVTDENGENLPGVSVSIKGTNKGTITDAQGKYTLNVSGDGDILVFSFVGYETQEKTAGSASQINITLNSDTKSLEEVVIVGYGTQKRATVTGAISAIKGDEIAKVPVPNISQSLAGRTAGVSMRPNGGQPGNDNPRLYVRGIGTTGNNEPLVVVDGIRRDNISQVDPETVESITILKDAAAVAPYGIGGANGVILITTKTGKSGKPQMRISSSYGFQNPTYLPNVLSAKDYMALQNEAYKNQNPSGTTLPFDPAFVSDYDNLHKQDPWKYPNSNFVDVFKSNIPMQKHNLEFSGGTDNISYSAGLGFFDQQGIFDKTNYKRYNYNLSLQMNATKTTKVGMSVFGGIERRNDVDDDSNGGLFRAFYKFLPTQSLVFPEGDKWGESSASSPVGALNAPGYQRIDQNTLLGSVFVEQQLAKGLSVKGVLSYDPRVIDRKFWHVPIVYHKIDLSQQPYTYSEAISLQEGRATPYTWLRLENDKRTNLTYQGYLNYNRTFGNHSISGLAVVEARTITTSEWMTRRNNFALQIDEMSFGSSDKLDYDNSGVSGTGSELGYVYRVGYSYKDKYMLEASGRYDGHYYFAPGQRWGYFPAFSAAWRVSEESFFKSNFRSVDELKIRGSWGKAGMLAGSAFQYLAGYDLRGNAYAFGTGTLVQGSRVPREPNPNITWEVAVKSDVGFDLSMWKSLFTLSFDYFHERRTGMLLAPQVTLPVEYGLSLSQENKGEMTGHGIEIEIGSRKRINKDLNFAINGNFSYAMNRMVEVFQTDAEANNPNRTKIGRQHETLFGYKSLGMFTTADDKNGDGIINAEDGYNIAQFGDLHPGDIRYADLSGPNGVPDGRIDAHDQTVIGRPYYPAITFGITPSVNWKGFDLNLFFQGAAMSNINIRQFQTVPFENNGSNTAYEYFNNRWTPDNQNAKYPRATPAPYSNNTQNSDFWIANSSYLRLRTLTLGYSLPKAIAQKIAMTNARVYVVAQNLFTLSQIKHVDPEMGFQNRETAYPVMKTNTFGIDLTF